MLTALLCAGSLGVGIYLGGISVRASMDHLVREAQAELARTIENATAMRRLYSSAAGHMVDLRAEVARLRRQNIALRTRCGAPPELTDRELQEWT